MQTPATMDAAPPSVFQAIPTSPALGNLDINRVIVADTSIDPANLTTPKSPVNPAVTDDMVQSAELGFRFRAVEGERYAPGLMEGIAAILQRLDTIINHMSAIDNRLGAMVDRLDTIDHHLETIGDHAHFHTATTLSHRTIARNLLNQPKLQTAQKNRSGRWFGACQCHHTSA
ncbi:hypothetical protein BDZ97DRAFT_356841 [Flammula alnicola]|nr:hypothetical protein BDZ97DRAFT_356841 [Flammula alnicola]